MTAIERELRDIALELHELVSRARNPDIVDTLQNLKEAADRVGKAWSGSWLGYHAYVYYKGFQKPPQSARFSSEWGLNQTVFANDGTVGDWAKYDPPEVEAMIDIIAGKPDMTYVERFEEYIRRTIERARDDLLSVIEMDPQHADSPYLTKTNERLADLSLRHAEEYLASWRPKVGITRDRRALGQGDQNPPHLRTLAHVSSIEHTLKTLEIVAESADQLAMHFARRNMQDNPARAPGRKIFLGHGHSLLWRELKDFLEDRLGLEVEEFNRVPTAGVSTVSRLASMMDEAGFALLIMTGEDEGDDGKVVARENVVHEMGLFQGRLGFKKAIVVLEEGCEEFSNIHGLGHIPFPEGKIGASFEEIRRVLEREGLIHKVNAT